VQSRKDLFQAHRLMTQRASLALLRGEPDIPDQPLRRLNVATFSGVLVAVIACALFGMWGLLGHGGSALKQQPGLLVIDQQTGSSYVFCQRDKLCPVLNYASARLALQSPSVTQQAVSQASLTKFARGPLIGIPGLPQPLPEASLLVRQPWSVCSQSGVGLAGQQTRTALAGGVATGGQPLGGQALLTRALGQDWVVWDGERMPIQPGTLAELFSSRTPVPVPTVWLNVLPQGPAFAPPAIAGQGTMVTGPAGPVQVGQVYDVRLVAGSPLQYYVMLAGGLARITKTQAELLDSELHAPPPAKLNPSQISGHMSAARISAGGLPESVPAIAGTSPSAPLCVVYATQGGGTRMARQVVLGGRMPSGGVPTGAPAGVGQVVLPPGAGALVGATPGNGASGTAISYFLVSGGRRYALASKSVAGMLGYDLSPEAVLLPASVIDLIPAGPALDPVAAVKPVGSGG
jgi:type VII secretion protein EccB